VGFGQVANFFIAGTRITKLGMHNLKPFHSLVEVLYNVAALDHCLLFLVHVNELIDRPILNFTVRVKTCADDAKMYVPT